MARLLGEARVAVLPDGTRFKPETEAVVKKATANLNGIIGLKANDKEFKADSKLAAEEVSKTTKAVIEIDGDARPLDAKLAELKARSEALRQSLGNLKIKTSEDSGGFLNAMRKQADELRSSLDKIGNSQGIDKADSQLQRLIAQSDKVRSAMGKVTFAEEEVAARARETAVKVEDAARRQTTAYEKAGQAVRKFASDVKMKQGTGDVKIKVRLDETLSDVQMANLRMRLDRIKADVHVGLDEGKAETEAVGLRAKLDAILDRIKARVHVDEGAASGVLAFFKGKFTKEMFTAGGDAGNGFGKGFISKLGKSAMFQNPGITALVIAGLAALPAAVGAIGTLGGIALGAGLIFAAEKLIKSQIKTLQQNLKTALTGAGTPATPQRIATDKLNIQNTQDTINRLSASNKLTASQQQQLAIAKQRLVIQRQTLAADQAKGQGTGSSKAQAAADQRQIAIYQSYQKAFQNLNNAVGRLKLAFLDFAVVATKPLLKPFTEAVDYLSSQLKGPLAKSFHDLFTAVGPLVRPVEQSLLELVKGILPGLTFMLDKARGPLGDMFIKFGKIVGLRIGDWFKAATPYIKDSSRYLNALVDTLGKVVTWLIRFGGETAKAFSGSQFKGFGPLIERIANDLLKIVIPAFTEWTKIMAPVAKALLQIMVPILDFLARNPGLVKAITLVVTAFIGFNKIKAVMLGVRGALGFLLANPWAVFAAEVALAVYEIVTHWNTIVNFFKKFWPWFIGAATGTIGLLVVYIIKHWSQVAGETARIWGGIVKFFKGLWHDISSGVVSAWNGIFNFLKGIWGHIENAVTGVFKPIASVVGGVWNEILRITHDVWNGMWKVIKPIVLIIVGFIGEYWRGLRNLTVAIWHGIYDGIVHPLAVAWTWIYKNFLVPVGRAFKGAWNDIKAATVDTFSHVYNYITHTLAACWNWVYRNFLLPIGRGFKAAWDAIKTVTVDTFKHVYDYITHTLSAVWNWVYHNFLLPVARGFKAQWDNLKTITRDAFNWLHDHIIGPLQKAWDWIGNKFVAGIKGAFNGLVRGVKAIWNGLKKVVADPINFVGNNIWNKFAGFVNKGLSIFGIKDRLPGFKTIQFAKGGHVPGYAPGKDVVPAMLSPGEFVIRPEVVKNVGVKNLHALNESGANPRFKPYVPPTAPFPGNVGKGDKPYKPHFADGGAIEKSMLNFMLSKKGQPYSQANRWGEPPWDCSSLVWQAAAQAGVPIPKSQAIASLEANWFRNSAWAKQSHDYAVQGRSQVQPGDIVFMRGASPDPSTFGPVGHVGMALGSDSMISALGSRYGVTTSTIDGFQGAIRLGGPGGTDVLAALGKAALGALSFVLKPLAQLALNGVEGLVNGALGHIPGKGPIPKLAKAAIDKVLEAAKNKITGNQGNYDTVGGGSAPAGGATGSALANGREMYSYLLSNLFGGHKIAAAGAIASIYGESGWNPYAQGTGGRGLIGWTPPGKISDATFKGGMRTQLPAIIDFVRSNGDMGVINQMNRATSVLQAANEWGRGVERFGINDVHPFGVRLAEQIMAGMANGGSVGQPQHFARGGLVMPAYANGGTVRAPSLQQQHDADVLQYDHYAALYRKALKAHDLVREVRYSKDAARYAKDIAKIDAQIRAARAPKPKPKPVTPIKGSNSAPSLQQQHDAYVLQYDHYLALTRKAKAQGDLVKYVRYSKDVARYGKDIAKVNKEIAAAKHKSAGKPRSHGPSPSEIAAYNVMTDKASAWQAAEQTAYGRLPAAQAAALAYRQSREQLAYWKMINAGVLKGDPTGLANSARSMLGAAHDKNLTKALGELASLTRVPGTIVPKSGGRASSAGVKLAAGLMHSQYLADLKAVQGVPLSKIRSDRHLAHLAHLLHVQHLADEGKPFARGGPVFDRGGTLSPGKNVVYNLTGRPEPLVPAGSASSNVHVTVELGPSFKKVGLTAEQLADIRYTVRTKGGRGPDAVQKAFGGH